MRFATALEHDVVMAIRRHAEAEGAARGMGWGRPSRGILVWGMPGRGDGGNKGR